MYNGVFETGMALSPQCKFVTFVTINFVTIKDPSELMSKSPDNFDLETFLPFCLHQAAEAVSRSFRAVYREEYGMSRTEWRVLAHLGQYGPMTATQIGTCASLHKTKVSRAVFSLEKRRWLARQTEPSDRRVHNLGLTAAGAAAYHKLGKLAHGYNATLSQKLGRKEFEAILALSKALQQATAPN
jgi:DNA-binding MarR family transcriptional regulator